MKYLPLIFLLWTANVRTDVLEIYEQRGYPVPEASFVVQFPFVHALIERLDRDGDRFVYALLCLVTESHDEVKELKGLIKIEKDLTITANPDKTLQRIKKELYVDRWWETEDF